MKILDRRVDDDIQAGRPLKLELGSGGAQRSGFYGVDLLPLEGVAIQADLNEPLDLIPDNSVAEIFSYHCLEHVDRFLPLMRELHRIMRPDAHAEIIVPHFSNPYHYSDPTHVRTFGLYTLSYFSDSKDQQLRKVPSFYSDTRFKVRDIELRLLNRKWIDRLLFPFLSRTVNRSFAWQDRFERRLCGLIPANEIRFVFSPLK